MSAWSGYQKKGEHVRTFVSMKTGYNVHPLNLLTKYLRDVAGHHLEEDVVASFIRKLVCHSGLLQQIYKYCS